MDAGLILSVQYDIPLFFSSKYKTTEEIVVDFLVYTRRKNYTITFGEISRYVHYDIKQVLELLEKYPEYKSPDICELINRLGCDLNLNYKQQCITKALFKAYDDYTCPFVLLAACVCLTYEILQRNYSVEEVVQKIKPKFVLLNVVNVKNKLEEIKSIKLNIESNNSYANEQLRKYNTIE